MIFFLEKDKDKKFGFVNGGDFFSFWTNLAAYEAFL